VKVDDHEVVVADEGGWTMVVRRMMVGWGRTEREWRRE